MKYSATDTKGIARKCYVAFESLGSLVSNRSD